MTMADMHDSGYYQFNSWAKQEIMPNGRIFWNRWLGEFNPHMSADEANRRSDHVGKLTHSGQEAFKRGWSKAQAEYLVKHPSAARAPG